MNNVGDNSAGGRGAFFDVDYTLLSSNSATLFVRYQMKRGEMGFKDLAVSMYWLARYKLNLLDFATVAEQALAKSAGTSEAEMIELCDEWFADMVIQYIYPEAKDLIEERRAAGDVIVLLSAATVYIVRPLARHLGIDHVLCNRPEVDAKGLFTGKLLKPYSYGEGKLDLARNFAEKNGLDISNSLYYSDSITDLPVLEEFGMPVAVNPDRLLQREAKLRGWPVMEFSMTNRQST